MINWSNNAIITGAFIVDGKSVFYSQEVHFTFWCAMEFTNFPLDTQECLFQVCPFDFDSYVTTNSFWELKKELCYVCFTFLKWNIWQDLFPYQFQFHEGPLSILILKSNWKVCQHLYKQLSYNGGKSYSNH